MFVLWEVFFERGVRAFCSSASAVRVSLTQRKYFTRVLPRTLTRSNTYFTRTPHSNTSLKHLGTDTAQRYLKSVQFHNVPDWMLDSGDHLSLEIISGFWTKEPRVSVAKQGVMFNTNKDKRTVEIDFTCKDSLDGVEISEEVKFVLYYKGSWSRKTFLFLDSRLVCGIESCTTRKKWMVYTRTRNTRKYQNRSWWNSTSHR